MRPASAKFTITITVEQHGDQLILKKIPQEQTISEEFLLLQYAYQLVTEGIHTTFDHVERFVTRHVEESGGSMDTINPRN